MLKEVISVAEIEEDYQDYLATIFSTIINIKTSVDDVEISDIHMEVDY